MNHVNFNDSVKRLKMPVQLNNFLTPVSFTSPLFLWDFIESPENNVDVMNALSAEPNLLPFRVMRLQMIAPSFARSQGDKGMKFWITHENGNLKAVCHSGEITSFFQILKDDKNLYGCHLYNGKLVGDEILKENGASGTGAGCDLLFNLLAWFIRDYASPQNFVASVSPDKKGKSVEWQQARTHYVLLNRHHPANNKAVVKGAQVAPGDEYIQRRAHSRRAHARVLRSPRFKNKIGQTVRVKACWVGPDEWKQFGSIYKMAKLSPVPLS